MIKFEKQYQYSNVFNISLVDPLTSPVTLQNYYILLKFAV